MPFYYQDNTDVHFSGQVLLIVVLVITCFNLIVHVKHLKFMSRARLVEGKKLRFRLIQIIMGINIVYCCISLLESCIQLIVSPSKTIHLKGYCGTIMIIRDTLMAWSQLSLATLTAQTYYDLKQGHFYSDFKVKLGLILIKLTLLIFFIFSSTDKQFSVDSLHSFCKVIKTKPESLGVLLIWGLIYDLTSYSIVVFTIKYLRVCTRASEDAAHHLSKKYYYTSMLLFLPLIASLIIKEIIINTQLPDNWILAGLEASLRLSNELSILIIPGVITLIHRPIRTSLLIDQYYSRVTSPGPDIMLEERYSY